MPLMKKRALMRNELQQQKLKITEFHLENNKATQKGVQREKTSKKRITSGGRGENEWDNKHDELNDKTKQKSAEVLLKGDIRVKTHMFQLQRSDSKQKRNARKTVTTNR